MSAVERAAEAVLVVHQRQGSRSCQCGDLPLGSSFPGHQVAMLAAAGLLRDEDGVQAHRLLTAYEIDDLPIGSVVLDGTGDAWQRSDAMSNWWAPANPFYVESDADNIIELGGTDNPPTLIHVPGTQAWHGDEA